MCNDIHFSDLPKQIKENAWLAPCQMFTAFPGKQILFVTYIKPEVNNASCRRQEHILPLPTVTSFAFDKNRSDQGFLRLRSSSLCG